MIDTLLPPVCLAPVLVHGLCLKPRVGVRSWNQSSDPPRSKSSQREIPSTSNGATQNSGQISKGRHQKSLRRGGDLPFWRCCPHRRYGRTYRTTRLSRSPLERFPKLRIHLSFVKHPSVQRRSQQSFYLWTLNAFQLCRALNKVD